MLPKGIVFAAVLGLALALQPPVGGEAGSFTKMYWTDAGTDKIQRADLDGSDVEDLVTGFPNAFGIALYAPAPPPAVGGMAELPEVSDSAGRNYVGLAGLATALLAFAAGAWYARRRLLR